MDTNEKNNKQKTAEGGLKAAQKAVITAKAKMDELSYVVLLARARQLAAVKMTMLGEAEAEWIDSFYKANNGAVLSYDDGLEVMSRGVLADELITEGNHLEIEMNNKHEKAEVDFNESLDVFERAKEVLALHQTKSNPLPPNQPKRI